MGQQQFKHSARLFKSVFLILSFMVTAGCVTSQPQAPTSSLELQAIQSREFDTEFKVAFASIIEVFQDLGYIIEEADVDTGLVTAESPTIQEFRFFVGQVMKRREATAYVETLPSEMVKIRLNFVDAEESSSGYGMKGAKSFPVAEPILYQETFEKVQKAIFVRTSTT